jgi:hypothetical protein
MRQFHFTTKATQPIQRAHQPAPSLIPDKGKLIEMVNDFFGHLGLGLGFAPPTLVPPGEFGALELATCVLSYV